MAITKDTRTKEVVIRCDDEGTFASADVSKIEVVLEDNLIISKRALPPEVITLAEVDGIVSAVNVDLMAANTTLTAERDDLLFQVDEHNSIVAGKDATIATLQAQLNPVDENG